MTTLNLGMIGNSTWNALIDERASVVWACVPRVDGDPVFCKLLDGAETGRDSGFFDVELADFRHSTQHYLRNTAILTTTLADTHGGEIEIVDFAPRFKHYDRFYRPIMMVRRLRPTQGAPRIRIRLRPRFGYGAETPEVNRGSNHVRYTSDTTALRLTTDVAPSFVTDETWFVLEEPITLIFGVDEALRAPVADTARRFYESTLDYWQEWVRYLSIPFEWQEAVIRAAITLKLCNFEETGGIVAAATTSIPEAPGSGRNWDYRFCWLRDAYFVVHALNRLGATRTLEGYSAYITNIVAASADRPLQPVYGVSLETRLHERTMDSLTGYAGMGPVRAGNAAYTQVQHDVYGSVILACTQLFFDQRIMRPGTREHFDRLERLGRLAAASFDKPDAGLWEYRGRARVHTFSSVMCWAACDRLAKIAWRLGLPERAEHWRRTADDIRQVILDRAWRPEQNTFVESFDGKDLDASLLLMHDLGFVAADDPRFVGTVTAIEQRLRRGSYMMRYDATDDFGQPETSFAVCTFWYIDALAAIGRRKEARELFENILARRNHVGLLSEDIDPKTGALWGNFPQTYSMVGLINSAMRLSKSWEAAF
jgi:GH15 family glucan-1,4-alpha-glucosidase